MNHAWQIVKISRYLRTKILDKRVEIKNETIEQRFEFDRRHIPSKKQIEKC
jgi:hypothetical protein